MKKQEKYTYCMGELDRTRVFCGVYNNCGIDHSAAVMDISTCVVEFPALKLKNQLQAGGKGFFSRTIAADCATTEISVFIISH